MDTGNHVHKIFRIYIDILSVFGILSLKPLKGIIFFVISRFHLIVFALFFAYYFVCNRKFTNLPFSDSIVTYCQYIDKTAMTLCITLTFVDLTIFRKKHYKVFDLLSEIDEILAKNLKIHVNYRKCTRIAYVTATFNIITITTLVRRIFENKLTQDGVIQVTIFACGTFLILFFESFYCTIVLQILYRYSILSDHVETNYTEGQKEILFEIFVKTRKLINVINEEFGIFILLATGKHAQLYCFE